MNESEILKAISRGRTDFIFHLMQLDGWKASLHKGNVKVLQWLVYYNDVTAIRAILEKGADLSSINLDEELGNAAFFGHWKICDFLIAHGADVNARVPHTNETPLHNALCKAGRPYYFYTIKLLIENGAEVNAMTSPGIETGAFMRDVRTKGETPLHRAAAYGDEQMIQILIENGADVNAQDANGDTPMSWASYHLRPAKVLYLLNNAKYAVTERHIPKNISDHGDKWGNSMDWNLLGDYLPEQTDQQ